MRGMAKSFTLRFIGMGVALFAAASLVLTGYGLVQAWRVQGRVTQTIQSGLDVISSTLVTSSDGLASISQSLESISVTLKTLQGAALSAGGSLHSQSASLQSLSTLFGTDLPAALTGAQTAMLAAQGSAKDVEDTLQVLTTNPLFAAAPYNPAVPLSTALSGVAGGLGALPAPMQAVGVDLSTAGGDLSTLETTITGLAASLDQLQVKLSDARTVVQRYQDQLNNLRSRVLSLRAGVPKWVGWAVWGLTFLMVWLGILQFFVLVRGWRWMTRG